MSARILAVFILMLLPCLGSTSRPATSVVEAKTDGGLKRPSGASAAERSCFPNKSSLSYELSGHVKSVKAPTLVGDHSSAERTLRNRGFPYSNSYCRDRNDQYVEFVPVGCSLRPFDPEAFLKQVRGRRVVLWGDSVQRQFFTYLSVRLQHLASSNQRITNEAHYREVGGDCRSKLYPFKDTGVYLNEPCFDVKTDWSPHCHTYHGGRTSLCFVRADYDVVDTANVAFYNDLQPSDIVLVNTGLHHNFKFMLSKAIRRFAGLLGKQLEDGRPMPLWLWRDTSAQHFRGGIVGNYPKTKAESDKLRNVKSSFRCAKYPLADMRRSDWRNQVLDTVGQEAFKENKLNIPILRVWNTTALLSSKHPQRLKSFPIADCSHFCPTLGGVYEIWATLFANFLDTALRYEKDLKRPISNNGKKNNKSSWRYPSQRVDVI